MLDLNRQAAKLGAMWKETGILTNRSDERQR